MKINQIIAESVSQSINTEKKIGRIVSAIIKQNPQAAEEIGIHEIYKIAAGLVHKNPVEDEHDLVTQLKDELGLDIDEAELGDLSGKKLSRISKNKGRSFKKSINKLKDISATHSGRFDKVLLKKLTNPLSEKDEL